MRNINPSKAWVPESIPNSVLNKCTDHLIPALTIIIQRSIDHGKHASEIYRPVSLTSVPCKLLEHIICGHTMKHLEKHNVLTSLNHGLKSSYSYENATCSYHT